MKLKIDLSHQIKLFFSKNWIILLKCLTKLYHKKKKKKKHFFNDSIAYTFVYNKDKRDVKIGTLFPTVIEKKRGKKPCWVE